MNALKDCGVPETDQLRRDVFTLSHATRILDDLIDTTKSSEERESKKQLYLQGKFQEIVDSYDLNVLTEMNCVLLRRGSQQAVQNLLRDIFEIQEDIRYTNDPNQYYSLLEEEGVAFSHIVIESLSGDVNDKFKRVCAPLIQSMYVFDSLLDGEEDHRKGERTLKPDFRFYMIGTRLLISKFIDLLSTYPNKSVVCKECLKRMYAIGLEFSKKIIRV